MPERESQKVNCSKAVDFSRCTGVVTVGGSRHMTNEGANDNGQHLIHNRWVSGSSKPILIGIVSRRGGRKGRLGE